MTKILFKVIGWFYKLFTGDRSELMLKESEDKQVDRSEIHELDSSEREMFIPDEEPFVKRGPVQMDLRDPDGSFDFSDDDDDDDQPLDQNGYISPDIPSQHLLGDEHV